MIRALTFSLLLALPAVAYAQETMVVVQKRADSVGFYDVQSARPLATVPVGARPHELALSRDRKLAFVTNYGVDSYTAQDRGGNTISIIDLTAMKSIGEIDLGEFHRPHGIALGRSGRLYVTTDLPASLLVIDPDRRKIVRRIAIGQKLPHMVAVAPDEEKAWTANSGSGSVTAVSLRDGIVIRDIEIGGIPMGQALAADGSRLYVANRDGDAVTVIDTALDRVVHTIEVKGSPARLMFTPGNKHLLVSLMASGEAAVVDVATLREVHRFRVGDHPEGMNTDPAGRYVFISAQGENKVVRFSLPDWKPDLTIETGARPDPMVILQRRAKE